MAACVWFHQYFKSSLSANLLLTCVPGIAAFMNKEIKPLIFFLFFGFVQVDNSLKKTKSQARILAYTCIWMRLFEFVSRCLCFPESIFHFVKATIPGTQCSLTFVQQSCSENVHDIDTCGLLLKRRCQLLNGSFNGSTFVLWVQIHRVAG